MHALRVWAMHSLRACMVRALAVCQWRAHARLNMSATAWRMLPVRCSARMLRRGEGVGVLFAVWWLSGDAGGNEVGRGAPSDRRDCDRVRWIAGSSSAFERRSSRIRGGVLRRKRVGETDDDGDVGSVPSTVGDLGELPCELRCSRCSCISESVFRISPHTSSAKSSESRREPDDLREL